MNTEEPTPGAFGRGMRQRREALDISRQEAARKCGVGFTRWRQVERGWDNNTGGSYHIANPSIEFVVSVARGLNWDIEDALTDAGYDPANVTIPPPPAPNSGPDELVAVWPQLNEKQKKNLTATALLFADPRAVVDTTSPAPAGMTPTVPPLGNAVEVKTKARRR